MHMMPCYRYEKLFHILDEDHSGMLDFQEVMLCTLVTPL
jgi:Ca2+-binding EF-hand superfamily protein